MDTAALVDRMVDRYNRHDTKALAACYAPNAAIHPAGWFEEVDAGTWLTVTSLAHTSGGQTVTAAEVTTTGGIISTRRPGGTAWRVLLDLHPVGDWELQVADDELVRSWFRDGLIEDVALVVTLAGTTPAWP